MLIKRLLTLALLAIVATMTTSLEPAEAAGPAPAPVRVLTIGDSTTHGMSGDYTWRYWFYKELERQGRTPDMVGHRQDTSNPVTHIRSVDYANPNFDLDHSGEGGMKITAMRYDVKSVVATHQPDVVIILLGLNDIVQGVAPLTVAQHLDQMLKDVREVKPDADVIVVKQPATWYAGNRELNSRIDSFVPRRSTATSNVEIAEVPADFKVAQDTWDNFHPNTVGEIKLATEITRAYARLGHATQPIPPMSYPSPGPARAQTGLRGASQPARVHLAWVNPPGVTGATVAWRSTKTGKTGWLEVKGDRATVYKLVPGETYDFTVTPRRGHAVSNGRYASRISVKVV